jgi:hypothetical protein
MLFSGLNSVGSVLVDCMAYAADFGVYPMTLTASGEPMFFDNFPYYDDKGMVNHGSAGETITCSLTIGNWYAIVTDYGQTSCGMYYIDRNSGEEYTYEGEYVTSDYS